MSSPRAQPDKPLTPHHAWQPFTPRGVAAFATSTLTRVVLAQLAVALAVAAAVIWFLRVAWFPVVTAAIQELPATGMIRGEGLIFGGESKLVLAQNERLAIAVNVTGDAGMGHSADLQVTFERNRVAFCGALGCWWRPYPRGYLISFNRPELEPGWGAWRAPALALMALTAVASLYVMWWSLALLYMPLVKLIAFFADRVVTWRGAWRQSAAALLPGALLVAGGIVLYGFAAIDLFQLGLLYALHVVCGFIFVVTSPFFLPKMSAGSRQKNPFDASLPE